MIYSDRNGKTTTITSKQDKILSKIYSTAFGRAVIKPLTTPFISVLGGKILDSKHSKILIKPFIKANNINMNEYENRDFNSYNDFFTRKIKDNSRKINMEQNVLISPCDGKLISYNIDSNLNFKIKDSFYSVHTLLQNQDLADEFADGICVVIRLSVDNYHRYCYFDNAIKSDNAFIKGKLHTVNPIAFDFIPVFKENSREYCIMDTENFGRAVQVEVGALMVGRINNYHNRGTVKRGQEKGKFEFGGSTIVLLLKKDSVKIDEDIIKNSTKGIETLVYMGEKIGSK